MGNAERYRLIGALSLCLFVMPALGWLTGHWLETRREAEFRAVMTETQKIVTPQEFDARGLSYMTVCAAPSADLEKFCEPADEVKYTKLAALGAAGLGALLILFILGGRIAAGESRTRLSVIFGPVVRIVMFLLAGSVLMQAALLVFSVYTVESILIQRVHVFLLGAVGLGAIAACLVLLSSSLSLMRREPLAIRGRALSPADEPSLFAFVAGIASKLKTAPPDNIVVGLEPNFFVTVSEVRLLGSNSGVLRGRTLFLSLSLSRVLRKPELAAVVGHELGHFRGDDVIYSMRFAPTYSRLGNAINALSAQSGNATDIAKVPAQLALSYCLMEFATAERKIGRERELVADRAGAEAASAEDLAAALMKVALYSARWPELTQLNVDEISKGRSFTNLARTFGEVCDELSRSIEWAAVRDALAVTVQPHPVDTHPPLSVRLQSLGVNLYDTPASAVLPGAPPATELVAHAEALEAELSDLDAQWLIAIGAVVPPEQAQAAAGLNT